MRKAVALAKAGDVHMLKFLLGRILPRERPIKLELPPLEFADDAVEALGRIMRAVSEGLISPSEGAALATLTNSYANAMTKLIWYNESTRSRLKVKGILAHEPSPI